MNKPTLSSSAPSCVAKLTAVIDRAKRGDAVAVEQLRLIGETLTLVGGVQALVALQDALHAYALERWNDGLRGSAIGKYWKHIPGWIAL